MNNIIEDSDFSGVNIIWMDPQINNNENRFYQFEMKRINNSKLFAYDNLEDGFEIILSIEFQKTYIIVNSTLAEKLFSFLDKNINKLKIVPEVIIFTLNRDNPIFRKFLNYTFFDYNFVYDSYKFVLNKLELRSNYIGRDFQKGYFNKNYDIFTFEHINSIDDLIFPIKFRNYIEFPSYFEIMNFNQFLIDKFSNKQIDYLINQLFMVKTIPISSLIKYWIRTYTLESNFYKEMNQYLLNKLGADYDIYIRALYYGLANESIPYYINSPLYRGAVILTKEIEELKSNKKSTFLPSYICFSKSFLSASLNYEVALEFMINSHPTENQSYVLYEIEKGNDIDCKNASNSDIQEFSYIKEEREILFFPFSSFEVGEIKKLKYGDKVFYNIKLYYLGKYEKLLPEINQNIPENIFTENILRTEIFNKTKISKLFNFNILKYYSPNYKVKQFTLLNQPIIEKYCTILTKKLEPPYYDILAKKEKKQYAPIIGIPILVTKDDPYSYNAIIENKYEKEKQTKEIKKEIDYISKCPILSCPNNSNYGYVYHCCGGKQKLEILTGNLKCIKCGETKHITKYSFRCIYHGYLEIKSDDIVNSLYPEEKYKGLSPLDWPFLCNKIKSKLNYIND